jgi:hypothetical protein
VQSVAFSFPHTPPFLPDRVNGDPVLMSQHASRLEQTQPVIFGLITQVWGET